MLGFYAFLCHAETKLEVRQIVQKGVSSIHLAGYYFNKTSTLTGKRKKLVSYSHSFIVGTLHSAVSN